MAAAWVIVETGSRIGLGELVAGPGVRAHLDAWRGNLPVAVQIIATGGLIMLATTEIRLGRRAALPLLLVACLIEGGWHGFQHFTTAFRGPSPPELRGYTDLARWMRTKTPPESLFLMPPQPGYTSSITHRSTVIDSKSLSLPFYMQGMTAPVLDLLREIYGFDLRSMSEEELNAFYNAPYTLAMEQRYERLDVGRIRAIQSFVPEIDFVVSYRPRASGIYRFGGPYRGRRLDLPIVYENTNYVVYDISGP